MNNDGNFYFLTEERYIIKDRDIALVKYHNRLHVCLLTRSKNIIVFCLPTDCVFTTTLNMSEQIDIAVYLVKQNMQPITIQFAVRLGLYIYIIFISVV